MNTTDISAAIRFSRTCLRAAHAAAARGQYRLAAELRAPAREALAQANAATAHFREPTPAQERARAIAATLIRGLH